TPPAVLPSPKGWAYLAAARAVGGAAGATVSGVSGGTVIERSPGHGSACTLERVDTAIAQAFGVSRRRHRRDDAPASRTLAALGTRDGNVHTGAVALEPLDRCLRDDEEHRQIVP